MLYTQPAPRGCRGEGQVNVFMNVYIPPVYTSDNYTHILVYVASRRDATRAKQIVKQNTPRRRRGGWFAEASSVGIRHGGGRCSSVSGSRAAPGARRWRVARCRVSAVAAVACAKRRNYYALDAPKTDPTIRTEKERIAVGETLRVNCISGRSRPASAVTWKLNGNRVSISSRHLVSCTPYAHMCARVRTCPRNSRGYVTSLGD